MTPNDPRHGTYNAYSNLGCRCADCREANRQFMTGARQRRYSQPLDDSDPRHGSVNLYRNFGCRCRPCTVAANAERLRYNPHKKAS